MLKKKLELIERYDERLENSSVYQIHYKEFLFGVRVYSKILFTTHLMEEAIRFFEVRENSIKREEFINRSSKRKIR